MLHSPYNILYTVKYTARYIWTIAIYNYIQQQIFFENNSEIFLYLQSDSKLLVDDVICGKWAQN